MKFNPDDPKWTAYVLGELDGEQLAAVEQELQASPAARHAVEAIRATAQQLEAELKREALTGLTPSQQNAIQQEAEHQQNALVQVASPSAPGLRWATASIAASLLIAVGAGYLLYNMQLGTVHRVATSSIVQPEMLPESQPLGSTSPPKSEAADASYPSILDGTSTVLKAQQSAANASTEAGRFARSGLPDLKTDAPSPIAGPSSMLSGTPSMSYGGDGPQGSMLSAGGMASAMPEPSSFSLHNYHRMYEVTDFGRINEPSSGEAYNSLTDNPFRSPKQAPLSTFSIDVDTGSYSNIRRFLTANRSLPPKDAVRIEELLNYFTYDYPQPEGDVPFSVTTEVASCPWNSGHRLVRIGLKGREIAEDKRPPSNLVFLIDVSGSMNEPAKLPLVKQALNLLVEKLTENDRVALVVYAGNSGLVLPSTTGDQQSTIREAIDRLSAGGSTNGGSGIQLAYETASRNFIQGGINRVILATDGDFNVGITSHEQLMKLIEEQAKSGVFLTALGFGSGNLKDATLEQLANRGNGNYGYIDNQKEAEKLFVEQIGGTLITIAKDVKIQIEFNPATVESYRLIGYENRILAAEDFNNDAKDAGEIGAGHTVTALYEVVPARSNIETAEAAAEVDPLRYQPQPVLPAEVSAALASKELLHLKLRYKLPDGDKSQLIEQPLKDEGRKYGEASTDFKFAAAVAAFGMILRDSPHRGDATLAAVAELAQEGIGDDPEGHRKEFLGLIGHARALSPK